MERAAAYACGVTHSSTDLPTAVPTIERELLEVARAASRASAAVLLSYYGNATGVRTKSTDTDLVSEADVNAERAIRALLAELRPGDAILGEEGGETAPTGESGIRWIVDPLDGTVNYLYQYPQWSVSVAAEDRHGTIAGVVWDPIREEEWSATRSGEPSVNGAPITASRQEDLGQLLVATGFAYESHIRARQAEVLRGLLPKIRDIRRGGGAALDLCWAAAGRVDAYFERGIHPWDYAAGALICERAGLAVRELPAEHELPFGLAVAPPAIVDHLHALVID